MPLRSFFLTCLLCVAVVSCVPPAVNAQNAPAKAPAKKPAAADPALGRIDDQPGLPRVLLIGDSISIGYTLDTRRLLQGAANVHRIPENGGPTTHGLAKIDAWLGDGRWDLIHFNWGLHDLKLVDGKHQVPLDQYEANLRKLVARMKQTGARLVWCSTTPVPGGTLSPPRSNADVLKYNAAARKVMEENDVAVDDLYAFALPRLAEMQRPANVHFTPAGSKTLAEEVTRQIRGFLTEKTSPAEKK